MAPGGPPLWSGIGRDNLKREVSPDGFRHGNSWVSLVVIRLEKKSLTPGENSLICKVKWDEVTHKCLKGGLICNDTSACEG